jgi:cholesterol oxidase
MISTPERCNNPVCRRVLFLFGESYRHAHLNLATNETLHELFGTTSLAALRHLSLMLRRRRAVDALGGNIYLPHADRLRLPITFLHGSENRQFLPCSTDATLKFLQSRNEQRGQTLYRRQEIAGYGHLDCFIGRNASQQVVPDVLSELERHRSDLSGGR